MSTNVAILGYWDIRGLAQPARLLLEYGGVQYEDRKMHMTKPEWMEYKPTLGFDFPNLPFYQDNDVKITQSRAIIKHLGRKLNLCGSTLKGQAEIDMLLDVVADYTTMMTGLCYSPDFSDKLKAEWITGTGIFAGRPGQLATRLNLLQDKLGENDWFVENKLSIADFSLWELLDAHRLLFHGCLDGFDKLNSFLQRFHNLKGVKEYISSPTYTEFPLWSVRAKYGFHKVE